MLRAKAEIAAHEEARKEAEKLFAENKPFPFDFTLPGLDNKHVSLAALKGRVTIVDFWAPGAAPAGRKSPTLSDCITHITTRG